MVLKKQYCTSFQVISKKKLHEVLPLFISMIKDGIKENKDIDPYDYKLDVYTDETDQYLNMYPPFELRTKKVDDGIKVIIYNCYYVVTRSSGIEFDAGIPIFTGIIGTEENFLNHLLELLNDKLNIELKSLEKNNEKEI